MLPIILQTSSNSSKEYLQPYLKKATLTFQIVPNSKDNISISQTKKLISSFNNSYPKDKLHLFNIHNAHSLTIPAQNNLLKILEESKNNKLIILATPRPNSLLPTIVSRCQIKKDTSPKTNNAHDKPDPSLHKWGPDPGQIITLTDQIISQNPQKYLKDCLYFIRKKNNKNPSLKRTQILKALTKCIQDLKANVNPKLALDHFFFTIRTQLSP
jgi:hypothetical protein